MAARKNTPPASANPMSDVTTKRNATAQSNAALSIDFDSGKSANELATEQAQTRSVWVQKLAALRDGIEAGKGQVDTFYCIGRFATASGARTVIRELGRRPERLPGTFDLEPRVITVAGSDGEGIRCSELWAAVPGDAADEAA